MRIQTRILGLSLAALTVGASALSAQQANASAITLGLAHSGVASARGLAALSMNPTIAPDARSTWRWRWTRASA